MRLRSELARAEKAVEELTAFIDNLTAGSFKKALGVVSDCDEPGLTTDDDIPKITTYGNEASTTPREG